MHLRRFRATRLSRWQGFVREQIMTDRPLLAVLCRYSLRRLLVRSNVNGWAAQNSIVPALNRFLPFVTGKNRPKTDITHATQIFEIESGSTQSPSVEFPTRAHPRDGPSILGRLQHFAKGSDRPIAAGHNRRRTAKSAYS